MAGSGVGRKFWGWRGGRAEAHCSGKRRGRGSAATGRDGKRLSGRRFDRISRPPEAGAVAAVASRVMALIAGAGRRSGGFGGWQSGQFHSLIKGGQRQLDPDLRHCQHRVPGQEMADPVTGAAFKDDGGLVGLL